MSKGKYRAHYTVDTIMVRSMSGTVTVKANNADKAREKALVKLARSYADITRIEIHEVYKIKVAGVEEEDAPEEDHESERRTAILNELAGDGVEITSDLYDWVVQRGEYTPDCRCGADNRRGIPHTKWCENREED